MTKTQFYFLGWLLVFVYSGSLFAQNPILWEYKGEKEGIKIYHQKTPGFLHIKLSTAVNAPLSGIAALFADVDHFTDWGYKMSESRMLRRVSNTEVLYYAKYDFPWPMDDRDIILLSKLEQDPITRKISIVNTPYPAYLPDYEGVVRIKNTTTHWFFIPGKDGWVFVEQQIATDSAEDMPEWLIKMTLETGPRETAKAIRKRLLLEQYQTVRLAHIRD